MSAGIRVPKTLNWRFGTFLSLCTGTDCAVSYAENPPLSDETIDIGAGVGYKIEVRRKGSDRGGM